MHANRSSDDDLVTAFVQGTLQPAGFDHRAHVRVACALLGRMPFLDACVAMRDGLAGRAGKPGLYHETLTVALMSLLAERLACIASTETPTDVDALLTARPDLLDRSMLAGHYSLGMLARDAARRRFVLPDPALLRERSPAAPSALPPQGETRR